MKKYLGLIITNAVLIGIYGLLYLVVGMVTLVQRFQMGVDWGIQWLFQYLFTLFFLTAVTLMAIFVRKERKYIVPVGAFVIYEWGCSTVGFISWITYPQGYSWAYIPEFVLLTAVLILSIIEFVFARPFSKVRNFEEDENTIEKTKPVSLEDISKAKELLDSGAITNEEFYEIKRRALK